MIAYLTFAELKSDELFIGVPSDDDNDGFLDTYFLWKKTPEEGRLNAKCLSRPIRAEMASGMKVIRVK